MKKLLRKITACDNISTIVLTPTDVVNMLKQIPELSNCNVSLTDMPDGDVEITIGENIFHLYGNQLIV